MKRVRTQDLHPGMIAAEDVYSYGNQMIIAKGTELDDKLITRLEFYSVLAIRVIDEGETKDESEVRENAVETAYSQKVRSSRHFQEFEKNFLKNTEDFKQTINAVVDGKATIDGNKMFQKIIGMFEGETSNISIFDMLHNMRQYDDFTYMHSINVALVCNVFAKWLGMSSKEVEIVTVGGLLHDIGKIKIPDNIMRKPTKLSPSEYNIIKTHSLQGYNILKEQNIDENIKQCALMHHERCDGTGYPLGLSGDKINSYAKIVAIADVYDAMTSARIYRGPLCPFRVIGIFEAEGLQKYDSRYILTFLEHIAETYMNNRVRLNNGDEGDVIFMNRNQYSRPMIQCGDKFIDLSKERDLYIETFV